jgi:hypothetical protein
VVTRELEAREKHGRVAQEFELAKLRVEAEKEVRIATAHAQASLFTKMQANLYGTTEDVQKLMNALVSGQTGASMIQGFMSHADDTTKAMLATLGKGVADLATSTAVRIRGEDKPEAREKAALPAE